MLCMGCDVINTKLNVSLFIGIIRNSLRESRAVFCYLTVLSLLYL